MNEAPRLNIVELTVSELSAQLKKTVEDAYGYVRVRGELGNVKYHSSGHIYLDLKDDRATLAGVVWRTAAPRIRVKLEAGLEVVVTGRITTFPGQSKYQIVIETVEPAGLGALMALVEERKKKLGAEGLFDPARKQLLPFLPAVIGVITSPTGAVIRDILHRLADRFPRRVLVWPVKVQGDGSAEEVAAAIRGFNALPEHGPIPRPDVLIVARGGGSLEDLWSFNEEIVVRAAADSMIPLVAAVGHETDVTLIDFAADRRAPTPTAAAEMAVPVRAELIDRVNSLARRNVACWLRGQEARRTELRSAVRALPDADDLLALPRQRLDAAAERLPLALKANAQQHHTRFSRIDAQFRPALVLSWTARERLRVQTSSERTVKALKVLQARRHDRFSAVALRLAAGVRANAQAHLVAVRHDRLRVTGLIERAHRAMDIVLDRRYARLDAAGQLLSAFSYRGVLERGFALVRDREGRPLRSAATVSSGKALEIEFSDGRVGAIAGDTRPVQPLSAPVRPRRRRSGGDVPGQGSLF
ncbi:MAG: exodeoxyribonuclease VII large subunit [Rhizobiales bacterium]|nr:exodeoxyribonuclease VII large subunit [Hyphomicrobiales bacterium]